MIDEAALRALIDRQAITDLLYRYARAMDRMDDPLGCTIWHEGSVADYGAAIYQGDGPGFIAFASASHAGLRVHQHLVGNIVIDLDGDSAGSEAYFFAQLRTADETAPRQIVTSGRYIDRWERRDGRWGIVHRQAIIDFDEVREVVPLGNAGQGRRDRDDPSYAVLGEYASTSR